MGGHDHGLALERGRDGQPAIPGQDPGIKRLNGMGVDGLGRTAAQKLGGGRRHAGVEARRRDPKALIRPASTVSVPPRGMAPMATSSMFKSSFARFFPTNSRGKFQTIVVLPSSMRPARNLFGIAEIDLGAGGAGRAEGQPAKLQLGGGHAARSS